jgi:hypothetical protein
MRKGASTGRLALSFLVSLLFGPTATWAQGNPLGPEFRVNTYTSGDQSASSVAVDSSGNFVVVWQSPQDGSITGIYGQRYVSTGAPLGPEFRVNSHTTSNQGRPSVAADSSGNFVIVWQSVGQDGSNYTYGIFGQRYASSGAPLGSEFRVNTYTTNGQTIPAVAADSVGNFVVVWDSIYSQDGSGHGIFGQRYEGSGGPLGPEFRVNSFTMGNQKAAAVTASAAGDFVVVWHSFAQDGSGYGVFGQRYANSGAPLGVEFRVNTFNTGHQSDPRVTSLPAGGFVVVWWSALQDGGAAGVFGQRYASSGAPLGPEFRVNTYTTGGQYVPAVTSDSDGNFVIVWHSMMQDGSDSGVFGQRYANSGSPLGAEFRVNTYTPFDQFFPSVAADAFGNFVVVWASERQDDPNIFFHGVFGQRYNQIVPVELIHFTVE